MVNGILQKNEIKKHSQPVTDIETQVLPWIDKMQKLCNQPNIGNYPGAVALAHCQVEKDNPLTFFVTYDGECIVNPEILECSEKFTHMEGCLSLAFRPRKKVQRYRNIRVAYTQIKNGEKRQILSDPITGLRACVFQHEINHFKQVYI